MIINPILPIPAMAVICIAMLLFARKGVGNFIRQLLIVLILFAINLRIMVGSPEVKTVETQVDVVFVIDNTISMLAEDYGDDEERRMDAVRADCSYIMDELSSANYTVISFANNAQVLIPLTKNKDNVMQGIDSLNGLAEITGKGTSLDKPKSVMKEVLSQDNDHAKIVFFISDGEITNNGDLDSYEGLAQYVSGGAVLGYGTKEGGPMQTKSYSGQEDVDYIYTYDDDFNRVKAISKLDEDNLEQIADDLGIEYVHMTQQAAIDDVLGDVKDIMDGKTQITVKDTLEGYVDTYYWLLIPLGALLIADYVIYRRKL